MRKRSQFYAAFSPTRVFHQLPRERYRQILTTLHNCWPHSRTSTGDASIACEALRAIGSLLSSPKAWV